MRFDLTDLSLFRHVAEAGSITHNKGRVEVKLTRNLAGGPQGFAKFPLSAALGAKRKAFTVTL